MRLTLNGVSKELPDEIGTLEELIRHLGIHRMIVVEHNGEIHRRDRFAGVRLKDGDVLEIVHMVGGGSSAGGGR